ncbi:hypothetical protein ACJRO7_017253 [Eucalyptus globulus]|uniref:Uncharacterized protein n=1 Tax=Eucalyptus globulus TaxID=34317 RepID=A0ABD3KQX1_EUCGL
MRRAIRTKEGQLGSNPTEEISSMRNSEQITAMRALPHCSKSTKNGSLLKSSLKRKSYEGSVANLMSFSPSEWPSESPSEKRSFRESSQAVVTEQVCNHENTDQSKMDSLSGDHPKFQLKISPKARSTEIGSPSVMESDENVEKAEAYTKELEDICNMLKKKQEEAKELLV